MNFVRGDNLELVEILRQYAQYIIIQLLVRTTNLTLSNTFNKITNTHKLFSNSEPVQDCFRKLRIYTDILSSSKSNNIQNTLCLSVLLLVYFQTFILISTPYFRCKYRFTSSCKFFIVPYTFMKSCNTSGTLKAN